MLRLPRFALFASVIAFVSLFGARGRATEPVALTTFPVLPAVTAGAHVSTTLTVAGGNAPFHFALVNPPSGWTINDAGSLSGTPGAGLTMVSVIVTDASGAFDQRLFEVWATNPATAIGVGNFSTLEAAGVGQPYAVRLYPAGGTAPFHWSAPASALPAGLALSDDGLLSGTPASAGAFSLAVSVVDATSKSAQATLTLRVDDVMPIAVTVDDATIVRASTPRIGLNIFDSRNYWSDVGLTNMMLLNPGMEPQRAMRRMYFAQGGTASSVTSGALYDGFRGDEPTGTFDGGTYRILSGPAKGRTGTISHQTRTDVGGGKFTETWTFADSNAAQVVRTATSQDPLDADLFMVEEPERAYLPGWSGRNLNGATLATDPTIFAAGKQSARLTSTTAHDVSISQTFFLQNVWARLRSDTTYGFSVDVRQHGLASSQVHVRVGTPFPKPAFMDQVFTVPDDGQFHHLSGTFQGGNQPDAAFDVAMTDAGTIWVDDALLWEAEATTTRPHASASAPVASEPFAPLPYVVDELRAAQIGCVRVWFFDEDVTLADALRKPTASDPAPAHNLFGDLSLAETLGSKAWIVAAKEWTPEEFAQLAEYLASTDTSKGMGALRASQGHPQPWTTTLPHVYIEYSDESWNWPNFAYPYDMWHPAKYAEASEDRFGAIKSSPYYTANMTLVLDGQARDDFWVNQPLDKLVYPSHDAMDGAPYVQAPTAWPSSEVGAELLGQYQSYAHDLPGTLTMFQNQGHATKLYVYEGGPGVGAYNAGIGERTRRDSIATTATYIDSVASLFEGGLGEYNTFLYQDGAWQATTGETSRFRLPEFHALSMFNAIAGDADQVAVTLPADAPTLVPFDDSDWSKGRVAGAPLPALSVRAYRKSGHTSFLVVNRSHAVARSVSLPSSASSVTVTTLAAASPDRGALAGPGLVSSVANPESTDASHVFESVTPSATNVAPSGGHVVVTLPPASIVTVSDLPANATDGGAPIDGGPDAGGTPTGDPSSAGCSCTTSRFPTSPSALASIAIPALLVLRRRRRR